MHQYGHYRPRHHHHHGGAGHWGVSPLAAGLLGVGLGYLGGEVFGGYGYPGVGYGGYGYPGVGYGVGGYGYPGAGYGSGFHYGPRPF